MSETFDSTTVPGFTGTPPAAPLPVGVASVPVGIDDVAAENARLRAELMAENAKLRTALADSAASALTSVGLTDEDVRRLEHPDEFVISNDELHARLTAIEAYSQGRPATVPETYAAPPTVAV